VTDAREPVPLAELRAAEARIAGSAVRTPCLRLPLADAPAEIYLKLENLQPIGSFKLRGAANALGLLGARRLEQGVYTASAGNWAQGLAWVARDLGIPCAAVVPDNAPRTKLAAIERLGARVIQRSYDEWWRVLVEGRCAGLEGTFVHPTSDPAVMAGNGTIGLEILEDVPDVDAIVVPYGGGGLACGIASAALALRPGTRVFAAEVDSAAHLAASLAAGEMRTVPWRASFVDGIGGKGLLAEMWPLSRRLLAGSLASSPAEIAGAVRLLAERARVVAEGAGAASLAPALAGRAGGGKVVCVVSGGNIDAAVLSRILAGEVP
jgi:threonine dehydratase